MNITEIQDLIKFVSKAGVSEVEIEQKDFKITIKSDGTAKRGRKNADPAVQQQFPVVTAMPQMPQMHQMPVAVPAPAAAPATPAPAADAPAASTPAAPAEDNANLVTIKSPMIGTFYRSSSPDKPPFVGVGDTVTAGTTICIVEAMKLFNEIEAEISGKIVKVLVDDSSPVQYDQPLFLVDPA